MHFNKKKMDFLAHWITIHGIFPSLEKVKVNKFYPKPITISHLRRFLKNFKLLQAFYRKRDGNFTASHLSFKKATKKNAKIGGLAHTEQALVVSTLLAYFDDLKKIFLACDAYNIGIAGVLQQKDDLHWKPLGFFLRAQTLTKSKYSISGCELLAIFCHNLERCEFGIFTDHMALTKAINAQTNNQSPRQDYMVWHGL